MARPIQIKVGNELITGSLASCLSESIGTAPPIGQITPIILEFDKYYPYDNGNGQPIYNENTGAELRDPVTGEPK
jgi:hypothetical protein